MQPGAQSAAILRECHDRSIRLLRANLTPHGIRAASFNRRAEARGYSAIFARDAAICALGMAVSGDPVLGARAASSLVTLAKHQAANGQFPKYVDPERDDADFWYLGCIDATLWWLAAIALLDRIRGTQLTARHARRVQRAIGWLQAQEHQRFHLLQQNEASDWADIMPRSGFVLYTNALWYLVQRLYRLHGAASTRTGINEVFHPFSTSRAQYRRARLLSDYVRRDARRRDLYLSFVNFGFFGDEGDVFGNLLAVLAGAVDPPAAGRILDALARAKVAAPYPVRVVCEPIEEGSVLWRAYMARHRQNFAWQYHNGGIWPFVGGFWVAALAAAGRRADASRDLAALARANALDRWRFSEWLHGRTLKSAGMRGQSWNAAAFLLAERAILTERSPFAT